MCAYKARKAGAVMHSHSINVWGQFIIEHGDGDGDDDADVFVECNGDPNVRERVPLYRT